MFFCWGFIPLYADLQKEINLLEKMQLQIDMMERELFEKISLAREKNISVVEDPDRIREKIDVLRKKLNLKLDELEPLRKRMRRKTLQDKLNLLEYEIGRERLKNIDKEISTLQKRYIEALDMTDISYGDVEFALYISEKGKDNFSEADIIPYFEKKLLREFVKNNVGTVFFLTIDNSFDYYNLPLEDFVPWAKNIPPFVSSAYKQAFLYERIATTLKEKSLKLKEKGYLTPVAIILHFNADGGTLFTLPRQVNDPRAGKLYPDLDNLKFFYPSPDKFISRIRKDMKFRLSQSLYELDQLKEESDPNYLAGKIEVLIDRVKKELDSLKKRFSSGYYKLQASPYGNYNIKEKLGQTYREIWEGLGEGLNPKRVNMLDTSVAARYGIQAYLLEVDNLQNTSPARMEKIARRLVKNYRKVIAKIAQKEGKSEETVKNTSCLLFIPGEILTDPNQAFARFTHYRKLAKQIEDREKKNPYLEQLSQEIRKYEEVRQVKVELEKLNLERESLIYVKNDNLNIKREIDRLVYALKVNEEILGLRKKIDTAKENLRLKKIFVYHRYNIDSPYLPLGIVSYQAGKPLTGIFFTLTEGYLLYSGVKEQDGTKIGLGFIIALLEIMHNRDIASEFNQNLYQKLKLTPEEDRMSIFLSLKF